MDGQLIPLIIVACLLVFLAFQIGMAFGEVTAKDEMIKRRIAKRVQRRMEAVTVKDVERELDDAAAKITGR